MKKNIFYLLTIIILAHSKVFAWGYRGHKIVAQLAKTLIEKNVADSAQYYLGEMTFENAAVWMDDIRSDRSYDYLKPMHYINIEKDKTYVKVSDPNIINELESVFGVLQNRSQRTKEIIKLNLLILFHLVGDLHQPLHAGYAEDKGGNTIDLDFQDSKTNLHKVWDTNIIETQNITAEDCLAIIKELSPKEKNAIGEINFTDWMNDSRDLLSKVYSLKGHEVEQDYISQSSVIIKKQLALAGIRLASALTKAFGKESASGTVQQIKKHN